MNLAWWSISWIRIFDLFHESSPAEFRAIQEDATVQCGATGFTEQGTVKHCLHLTTAANKEEYLRGASPFERCMEEAQLDLETVRILVVGGFKKRGAWPESRRCLPPSAPAWCSRRNTGIRASGSSQLCPQLPVWI